MTLSDIQLLAHIMREAEPAPAAGQAALAAWASICGQLAAGIRTHELVTDHPFDDETFLDACTTDLAYYLGEDA